MNESSQSRKIFVRFKEEREDKKRRAYERKN
jgi:hypothetical protein